MEREWRHLCSLQWFSFFTVMVDHGDPQKFLEVSTSQLPLNVIPIEHMVGAILVQGKMLKNDIFTSVVHRNLIEMSN